MKNKLSKLIMVTLILTFNGSLTIAASKEANVSKNQNSGKDITVYVNNKSLPTAEAPQVIGDKVLVSLQWVADALQATVRQDYTKNVVYITLPKILDQERLTRRVTLLESALEPDTQQAIAELWAKAVKNRNGAIQYMLLCPPLQKKYAADFDERYWVTGTSSPSILSYKISEANKKNYDLTYSVSLGVGEVTEKITLQNNPDSNSQVKFCINKVASVGQVDPQKTVLDFFN
jgi:hypothetical protein